MFVDECLSVGCPLAGVSVRSVDSRAAFGFSQFAADHLHASGAAQLEQGRYDAAFPLLARSAQRWEEALTIAPHEYRGAVRKNLATAVDELRQIGADLIDAGHDDDAHPFVAEALRHHDRAIEFATTDTRRAAAYLDRAQVVYSIGLDFVRARMLEKAGPYFAETGDDAASALAVAPTREGRVEGRFIATLAAIGLNQSRKEIGDTWFAVGTLARPADQPGFLRSLTEAAQAHQQGGYMAAAIHAEGLARTLKTTSPMAGVADGMAIVAPQ